MLNIKQPAINVLNKGDSPGKLSQNAVDVSKGLQKTMLRMKAEYMSDDGNAVDYELLKQSQLYKDYKLSTMKLHSVNLAKLSENEKQAFFINIYNALTIDGLASCKTLPSSVLDVQLFWKVTAYNIGSHDFSLDDIEHGILRGNRPHPSAKEPPLKPTDPRVAFAMKKLDPRIHFALVCGAKSCPAIQVYSAENVDRALDAATRAFCEQEVKVYEIQREIRVSQLFNWYCSDFGENDVGALRWTLLYLSPEKAKTLKHLVHQLEHEGMVDLNYSEYNWKLNNREEELENIQVDLLQPDLTGSERPGSREAAASRLSNSSDDGGAGCFSINRQTSNPSPTDSKEKKKKGRKSPSQKKSSPRV